MGLRYVTVVLHEPRGSLPPFTVPTPWWQEVESVVAEVRRLFDLDIVVLRILAGGQTFESPVTYLAELTSVHPANLQPWTNPIGDDPLRLPYARSGGPAADLARASSFVELVAPAVQVRTWNLSSIWRLPTSNGTVWLKHVPPFFDGIEETERAYHRDDVAVALRHAMERRRSDAINRRRGRRSCRASSSRAP